MHSSRYIPKKVGGKRGVDLRRILALDYGERHVGVAFTESLVAEPLKVLQNDTNIITKIKEVVSSLRPEEIVVGLPEGKISIKAKEFASSLKELGVPVNLHPETLSSNEAVSKLRQAGAKKSKLKNDQSYAAALILEDYLDLLSG